MPEIKTLLIRDLDDSFQIRKTTHEDAIDQYAEKMLESGGWGKFPPIDVVFVDGKYKIADGIHRFNAAKRAGLESVPCVVTQGTKLDLLRGSLVKNRRQGIGWPPSDSHHATRTVLEMYAAGDLGNLTKEELADLADCNERTIRRNIKKMEEEGWTFPETVIGKDGKEYHFQKKTGPDMSEPENPATPAIPHEYCAREGCGVPIWDDMKKAADCTYIESGGRWFCSEECARAYFEEHPEPWAPPDDGAETEPVIVGETVEIVDEDAPPARVPAPSSSQASGEEKEQEEPTEFAFNDVDAETLPVYTAEPVESTSCGRWIRCYVEVEGTTDPDEALRIIKAEMPISHGKLTLKFDGLNENINIQNLNNNININHETFTEFFINCRGKKGPVKVFISRKKYEGWQRQFGPSFDIDQNIRECCDYYNELTGSEMLSAGGVYSKVYAWLLKNWKQEQKGAKANSNSKPKGSRYRDAGVTFEDLIY